ncbi:MAG: NAD(P)(+) transhydrogenase (Re/Si-specific) subunit beta [Longimicrobiales bacterium]|nr:NAD(P)(+) transhydrogenase (Re/Si-specific) subunit beta [Longimicrobiales bacterium]
MSPVAINLVYIGAAALFIVGLKMLGRPESATRGNALSALGMAIAVAVTLFSREILTFEWIVVGVVIGSGVGAVAARRVAMTGMPEMVALFNGSGGAASLLVGWSALEASVLLGSSTLSTFSLITVALSIVIGGVTTTGSVVAWGKLSGRMGSAPVLLPGQAIVNLVLVAVALASAVAFVASPVPESLPFWLLLAAALVLGVTTVIPIGGADMPVVIALLNSYSGLAASAAGFAIGNLLLIVAGALVGASGLILTDIMCRAMNRSLSNVLFSGFGSIAEGTAVEGEAHPVSAEDAFLMIEAASSVVFVPGYGMAVAQAQHVVRELAEVLERNGAEVSFAIHPVAGRMPGHMNVLLAEANVSYDQLIDMEDANQILPRTDVAIVIGANDVVNPAAREDEASPIYGMPIINVDHARTVIVLKRSLGAGFSGVQNRLFFAENTRMLLGDAKTSLSALLGEFKG